MVSLEKKDIVKVKGIIKGIKASIYSLTTTSCIFCCLSKISEKLLGAGKYR